MIEIPGFEIKREIGASAMANVYLALQMSLDREVALKVMLLSLSEDPAFAERFTREARTLASLAHPHIVAVYDVDISPDKRHYFSMQYLPGGDLTARVRKGMDEAALIQTLDGVGQALEYVHQRGLVHRDISPSNILYDVSNSPVLTDFGIARALGSNAGSTGTDFAAVKGHYLSPEQARGASLDARADLYSLGALTWFALTGKPPYDGADGFAVAYAHVFEPIPRLPPAQAHWQPLIDRALAKEPAQRFATAREFLDALAKLASAPRSAETLRSPILTSPPPVAPAPASPPTSAKAAPVAGAATVKAAVLKPPPTRPADNSGATVMRPTLPPATPPVTPKPRGPVQTPAPRVPTSAPAPRIPAPVAVAKSSEKRLWPIIVVAVGLAAISIAVYTQIIRRPPPAPVVAEAPPAPMTPPPSVLTDVAPAPAQSSDASAPAVDTKAPDVTVSVSSSSSGPTDATAIPSLDAAAEAGLGEYAPVDLAKLPTVVEPAVEAVRWGRIALASQRLTTPPGNNALDYFQFSLKRDPQGKAAKSARQGIVDVAKKYVELADKGQNSGDLNAYLQFLTQADDVAKVLDEGAEVRKEVATRRAKAAEPYLAQAKSAAADWNKATAKAAYEKALEIDPNSAAAREGLKYVATIGEPGFAFRDKAGDASQGPEMLIIGGKIAVSRRDITRGEFRRYWAAAGRAAFSGKEPACRDRESFFRSSKERTWQSPGFDQDDSHPVVCVSWPEAAAFAQWLSKETGKRYRLLSPAEFDQIARGAPTDCAGANLADAAFNKKFESRDGASCDDGYAVTAPAGRFEASGGLYDASGNVRVWVAACGGGAAAPASGCRDYLAKGRSWMSPAKDSPTAGDSFNADVALNTVGFRLVREIDK